MSDKIQPKQFNGWRSFAAETLDIANEQQERFVWDYVGCDEHGNAIYQLRGTDIEMLVYEVKHHDG